MYEDQEQARCAEPSCSCQTGVEDNEHFLLHCPRFSTQRKTLLDLVSNLVGIDIMRLSSKELCTLLLYGNNDFSYLCQSWCYRGNHPIY